ncbi:MAG: hypothetical protein KAY24_06220, partial [Candidatus Eisenbacteria sp.]|nr:hypothetical protein [Candidatus Eisenbacteria bacterium]
MTTAADAGTAFLGEPTTITALATYYAGGALPGTEITWRVQAHPGSYRPPGWRGFTFGEWTPWWESGGSSSRWGDQRHVGRTDSHGHHRLEITFESGPPRPVSIRAEATVQDVNRQARSASSVLLLHAADLYTGLKCPRHTCRVRDTLHIEAIVTDLDGNAVAEREIIIAVERLEWRYEEREGKLIVAATRTDTLISAMEPIPWTFRPDEGRSWRLRATVIDDQGRRNRTSRRVWVPGGPVPPPSRRMSADRVTLIPDREEWSPGDTAHVMLQAPFLPAEALISLRREGFLKTWSRRLEGPEQMIDVPIESEYMPGLTLHVDLVGSAPRLGPDGEPLASLPRRPAYATGNLRLKVPPHERRLAVNASCADSVDYFYAFRATGTADMYGRRRVLLARPEDLAMEDESLLQSLGAAQGSAAMHVRGGRVSEVELGIAVDDVRLTGRADMSLELVRGAASGPDPGAIQVRSDFNALALFAPEVVTDAHGQATVAVRMPGNLTRYRVMVLAADAGNRFGAGESAVTTRLPLMVRCSPPRFLNYGDHCELSIVLQNRTGDPLSVDLVARASNLTLPAGNGRRVTVPAHDRVEVRLPAVTEEAGITEVQIGARSGSLADAIAVRIPVWTPATTEACATYGTLDEGAIRQMLRVPERAITDYGELEITTSSTALQALTDAVIYLATYPYRCAEQIASRVLTIAALKDVLTTFAAEGLPDPETLAQQMEVDITELIERQNSDGGWGLWRRRADSWPFVTIHAAHALARAKHMGYTVPESAWKRAHGYLKHIERRIPNWYSERVKRTIIAYALYVRLQMNDADPRKARGLIRDAGGCAEVPLEALGWLMPVLGEGGGAAQAELEKIHRHLENRVAETAATAQFVSRYEEDQYLIFHGARRTDALLLEGLLSTRPDSDLIIKIVRGLLAHRKRGRWGNTQENTWVLLALHHYFVIHEKVTPDFLARAWLGDQLVAEQAFRGRSTDRHQLTVPMSWLAERGGALDLHLQHEGQGRLYYRIGMRYAPDDLLPKSAAHGFHVTRVYEAIDDSTDVWRDEDGIWHVRAGSRVRVRLTMVAPARRYHVALEDRLPAGFEPLNPHLRGTGEIP